MLSDSFLRYTVKVDYDKSVKGLSKECNFDKIGDITGDNVTTCDFLPFDEKGQAELGIFLVVFDRKIDSNGAVLEMDQLGFRPATMKELLSLIVVRPKIQSKKYAIVALGSTWRSPYGDLCVPGVYQSKTLLHLRTLNWWVLDWPIGWQFVAVHK